MTIVHPDYSKLAARIAVSNLHKETESSFFNVADRLYNYTDNGAKAPLLADDVFEIIKKNKDLI